MNKKQIILTSLVVALMGVGSLKAQNTANTMAPTEKPYQDVTVSLYGPGMAAMTYAGGDAEWNNKIGYAIGLGADYTYWFSEKVGVTAGLKMTYMNSVHECTNYATSFSGPLSITTSGSAVTTPANTLFDLRGRANEVSETRTMSYVEIPVRLALDIDNIYLNLGVSAIVAMTNYASFYYEGTSYEITGLPTMGISLPNVPVSLQDTRSNTTFQSTDAAWPFYVLLAAEAGYKFRLDDRNAISLGVYGRYAVVDSKTNGELNAFNLNSNRRVYTSQPSSTSMVEKIGYYEFGLRIAYHYGIGKKKTYF